MIVGAPVCGVTVNEIWYVIAHKPYKNEYEGSTAAKLVTKDLCCVERSCTHC